MDISVNWLRALAPGLQGSAESLAAELAARAVPVDRIAPVGEGLADVVVGRVVSAQKHPNADRLTVCKVDAGEGSLRDVVCGAPNVVEGALYPFVPSGGTLPGGFLIERRRIRGEISDGMLCSEKELGLGRDAAGILRLADGHVPGHALQEALQLPDARLEIDLTPNRIDLACHAGVARELAPAGAAGVVLPSFGGPRWEPEWISGETTAASEGIRITIVDPERCCRYLGVVVRGVEVRPSPEWLQARLRAAGTRPINNVVDATNYVLLEVNQPLHAFDLSRIGGQEVQVRAARDEVLTTLDGQDHELSPDVTVIADAERPVALAGVMGGADSEVSAETTDLLLECAAFDSRHARRTSRATGLATDASYRFERGIDEAALEEAMRRCVELILSTAGGSAARGIRVGRAAAARPVVRLRTSRVRQVLGLRLSVEQIAGLLQPLGFVVTEAGPGGSRSAEIAVQVPGWRVDIRHEVDLLEEVARRYGYESFPHEARSFRPSVVPDSPLWQRADLARQALAGLGALEARSSSFVAPTRARAGAVPLLKPLSAAEGFLRTDLVPVLLGRVEHNYSRGHRDIRLYEIGTVFAPSAGDSAAPPAEEMRIGVVFTGSRRPDHWTGTPSDLDLWDLKGLLEELADRLGLGEVRPGTASGQGDGLPFGTAGWLGDEAFCIFGGGEVVGVAGRVMPDAIDTPPWASPVWAAEVRLGAVRLENASSFAPLPTYPSVSRDLAFIISADTPSSVVADAIREIAPSTLERLRLFDVFEGDQAGAGKKSLAWRLVFRAPDRTLTDEEVEDGMAVVIQNLESRFDVRVRSS